MKNPCLIVGVDICKYFWKNLVKSIGNRNAHILFLSFIYIYIFSTVQHGDPATLTCIHSFFSHYAFHHK